MKRKPAQKGFSLVEALVAMLIAAGVLGGFYQALSTGALLEQRADRQAEQALVAASVMDRVGLDLPLRAGARENGATRGLRWQMAVSAAPQRDMQLGQIVSGELLFVFVTVEPANTNRSPLVLRAIRYMDTPL